MVTYKEKTQTWKFGPPYPRGIYWLLEVLSVLLAIVIIVIATKGVVLLPLFRFGIHYTPLILIFSVLLLFLGIMLQSFIFIFIYSPRAVHLTYDEVILMKGLTGLIRKRIPFYKMKDVELFYFDEPDFMRISAQKTVRFLEYLLKRGIEKTCEDARSYMVSISLNNGKTCDFQVEEPQEFVKLVKEKMGKFRVEAKQF